MKLRMAKDSLFAILLRSPWWISIAVAAGIVAVVRLVLPGVPVAYAVFAALPFIVIGGSPAGGSFASRAGRGSSIRSSPFARCRGAISPVRWRTPSAVMVTP